MPSERPSDDTKFDTHESHYFIAQAEKLGALLDNVVIEAQAATDPDALIDFLELTAILADLSDAAHFYSVLPTEQLRLKDEEVRRFVDRIQALQALVGEDHQLAQTKTIPRKRPRSIDLEEETMEAFKRPREGNIVLEHDLDVRAVNDEVETAVPSIENSPSP